MTTDRDRLSQAARNVLESVHATKLRPGSAATQICLERSAKRLADLVQRYCDCTMPTSFKLGGAA